MYLNGKWYTRCDNYSNNMWTHSTINNSSDMVVLQISPLYYGGKEYSFFSGYDFTYIGWRTHFDPCGHLTFEQKYLSHLETEWRKFENSRLHSEGLSYDRALHGKIIEYYQNGNIRSINRFLKGLPIGEQQTFSISGHLEKHIYYFDHSTYIDMEDMDDKTKFYVMMCGGRVPTIFDHLVRRHSIPPSVNLTTRFPIYNH